MVVTRRARCIAPGPSCVDHALADPILPAGRAPYRARASAVASIAAMELG
jgi:hypothetical protein